MRLRLTAAGRRRLRRAKSLRLEIITRFAPASGKAVTVRNRVTVKRRGTRAGAATIRSPWTRVRVQR